MKFYNDDYISMQKRWERCRAAAAGEDEVHAGGEKWLPMLSLETQEDYKKRLHMTPFYNASWRTMIGLRGLMFRKDPIKSDNFELDFDHVELSKFCALESLTVGRVGLLVDFSNKPVIVPYVAESILDWKQGGMVRLLDGVLENQKEIHRILKLENGVYIQRIYEVSIATGKEELIEEIIPKIKGGSLDYIPFVIIGVDSLDWEAEIPPLIDLVNINMHHYVMSSAYERGCFLSGLPSMFIYGNRDTTKVIYIGSSVANSFPDPDTRAEILEVKGNFGALKENLEKKEMQMASLGAKMLEPQKAGVEAEGTLERRMSGEESILADMASTLSNGLTLAIKYYLKWITDNVDDFSLEINREFLPTKLTAQELTSIMLAWQGGAISKETLFYNYKKAGIIEENVTFEDEQSRSEIASPFTNDTERVTNKAS